MRVLFRVALALLIGIPVCLALGVFFLLQAGVSASPALDRDAVTASGRTQLGPHRPAA